MKPCALLRLALSFCVAACCIPGAVAAEASPFYRPAMDDLVAAAQARGFPARLRILAIDRDTAQRYIGHEDGAERMFADCHREVAGDDGSASAEELLGKIPGDASALSDDVIRCAVVANTLFDAGATAAYTLDEIAFAPLRMGSKTWRSISDAIAGRVGDEIALALIAGHEMAHVAWRQGVHKAAHARGCGDDCDPALFHEPDLEEAYCDFLAAWIVAVRHRRPPEELLAALAAGRATLNSRDYGNEWQALAGTLAEARIPGYERMDFAQASETALAWALRVPGLRERWVMVE